MAKITTSRNMANTLLRLGLVLFIILLSTVTTIWRPVFLTTENLINVVRQISMNGILAVGITFVILTGGIDLSIGSIVAVTSVIAGKAMDGGHSAGYAILLGMIAAVLFGIANGSLISLCGLPPFIATLSTMAIARGFALVYAHGRPYLILNDTFLAIGKGWDLSASSSGRIPNPVVILFVVCVLAFIVLKFTIFGRHVYAFGGNRNAAKLAGVRTKLVEMSVYTISGFLAGVCAIILSARIGSGQPIAGQSYEMDAIAATAIGGTSMIGGSGSILGTILGFILIGVMLNSMTLFGVDSYFQQIVKGALIIFAVMLDMMIKKRSQ
jgi:ribose/xylose/arabinose/galactoside ABC-type transport system permease subunit